MAAFPDLIPQQVNQNLIGNRSSLENAYSATKLVISPLKQDGTAWDSSNAAAVILASNNGNNGYTAITSQVTPATFVGSATTLTITLTAAEMATLLTSLGTLQGKFTVTVQDTIPNDLVVAAGLFQINLLA